MKRVRQVLAYPFRLAAIVCGLFAALCMGVEWLIVDGEWSL